MKENIVTVIVPVYNVQDFLEECLESVINQSYKNLDIILVDDGSTDESGTICEYYAKKDRRIRVLHQVNQGLSVARNSGIDNMQGRYVYFLDSDDCIASDTIEVLLDDITRYNADIVISRIVMFSESKPVHKNEVYDSKLVSSENALEKMLLNNGIGHEACGKLFKACLWEDYRFPVGKLYEDYATIYYVVANTKKVVISDYPSYFYRVRLGSIMHSSVQERSFILLDISDEVTDFLIQQYPSLKEPAIRLNIITYLKMLKIILDKDMNAYQSVQKRIMTRIGIYKSIFLNYRKVRFIDKIKVYCLILGKYPFFYVYCIGDIINTWRLKLNEAK